jgi:hypothetical protein
LPNRGGRRSAAGRLPERRAGADRRPAIGRQRRTGRRVSSLERPDGAAINGTGIAPELPVDEKVADFLAGRDAVLERARAYITERSLQH